MNILVTGGAGFIGCNFIKYMYARYNDEVQIVNIDNLTYAGNLSNLKDIENRKNYKFIKGDICNKELVYEIFSKYKLDYVVNFAAESHVDRSIENPEIFIKTNVIGTQILLNAALKYGVKKFHQVSTDEVYGTLGESGYFTETTPLDPHSPYSASKASADLLVKAYFDTYGLPINITRCSNNYGPYQFPEKLIPLMINNCVNKKFMPVYGTGKNVRDWLYVDDHCKAIDCVISKADPGKIYNVGGKNEMQNISIVKIIIDFLRKELNDKTITNDLIKYVKDRKGHDWRYAIDSSLISNELNWYPEFKFEYAIIKTIKWYLENIDWVKSTVSGEYKEYYTKIYSGRFKRG